MKIATTFASLAIGVLGGFLLSEFIQEGRQPTYFEANALEYFFLSNPNASNEVAATTVFEGDWSEICLFGPGVSAMAALEKSVDGGGYRIVSGRVVDEGLLDYLHKVVLTDGTGRASIMNFDEREFRFRSANQCMRLDGLTIIRKLERHKTDPDGFGSFFTVYELRATAS